MTGRQCKCGCGTSIPASRRYFNKEHQLLHMRAGEASRLNAPADRRQAERRPHGRASRCCLGATERSESERSSTVEGDCPAARRAPLTLRRDETSRRVASAG